MNRTRLGNYKIDVYGVTCYYKKEDVDKVLKHSGFKTLEEAYEHNGATMLSYVSVFCKPFRTI